MSKRTDYPLCDAIPKCAFDPRRSYYMGWGDWDVDVPPEYQAEQSQGITRALHRTTGGKGCIGRIK